MPSLIGHGRAGRKRRHSADRRGGVRRDPEAVKRNVTAYLAGFPDLEWRIELMIAEDDWVAVRLVLHGTHRGEFAGIPPTGALAVRWR